jgi:ribosomal protein L3 glutamine methyltransferase
MTEEPHIPQTLGQALQYCSDTLAASDAFYGHGTDNPWDEAVQLVLSLADLSMDAQEAVLPHPVDAHFLARLKSLMGQRIEQRIPMPYLLGKAWFAGLEFLCDERALIPRSPLAELILSEFQPWYVGAKPQRVLDLCCGGGCIGLAVAHYYPELHVDLLDLDEGALSLARENAAQLGVQERVSIGQSDLFSALQNQQYDLILSNPPYVNAADLASMPREYRHEPELALGSGEDGLMLARRILAQAGQFLRPDGLLVVEVGNSGEALEEEFPDVPFTWLEFEHGGDGVFALTFQEWQDYKESLVR